MRMDIHDGLSRALGKIAGLTRSQILRIAWANWYTDRCKGGLFNLGFRTQVGIISHFYSKVGLSFHFLPGDNISNSLITTQNSKLVLKLANLEHLTGVQMLDSVIKDVARGIAIHSLQDTYSHQEFIGLYHVVNNCWPWLNIRRKQYGHMDMLNIPDMIDHQWTDQRSGYHIDNSIRGKEALVATASIFGLKEDDIPAAVLDVLKLKNYDERKQAWIRISGTSPVKMRKLHKEYKRKYGKIFKIVAKQQITFVQKWLEEQQ